MSAHVSNICPKPSTESGCPYVHIIHKLLLEVHHGTDIDRTYLLSHPSILKEHADNTRQAFRHHYDYSSTLVNLLNEAVPQCFGGARKKWLFDDFDPDSKDYLLPEKSELDKAVQDAKKLYEGSGRCSEITVKVNNIGDLERTLAYFTEEMLETLDVEYAEELKRRGTTPEEVKKKFRKTAVSYEDIKHNNYKSRKKISLNDGYVTFYVGLSREWLPDGTPPYFLRYGRDKSAGSTIMKSIRKYAELMLQREVRDYLADKLGFKIKPNNHKGEKKKSNGELSFDDNGNILIDNFNDIYRRLVSNDLGATTYVFPSPKMVKSGYCRREGTSLSSRISKRFIRDPLFKLRKKLGLENILKVTPDIKIHQNSYDLEPRKGQEHKSRGSMEGHIKDFLLHLETIWLGGDKKSRIRGMAGSRKHRRQPHVFYEKDRLISLDKGFFDSPNIRLFLGLYKNRDKSQENMANYLHKTFTHYLHKTMGDVEEILQATVEAYKDDRGENTPLFIRQMIDSIQEHRKMLYSSIDKNTKRKLKKGNKIMHRPILPNKPNKDDLSELISAGFI